MILLLSKKWVKIIKNPLILWLFIILILNLVVNSLNLATVSIMFSLNLKILKKLFKAIKCNFLNFSILMITLSIIVIISLILSPIILIKFFISLIPIKSPTLIFLNLCFLSSILVLLSFPLSLLLLSFLPFPAFLPNLSLLFSSYYSYLLYCFTYFYLILFAFQIIFYLYKYYLLFFTQFLFYIYFFTFK